MKEYERLEDIEDAYWVNKAKEAEAEGYLGEKESMDFLNSIDR
ncbi:hypothetical protein MCHI_002693 [Candidatus Magnetoovum chiemensis]|nr:hypothetical protein MCHI_002693 [Candidatus Magnetoovum chiemensis]